MTARLKRDMTVLVAVMKSHWAEFTRLAEEKLSAADNREYCANQALADWHVPVSKSLKNALESPDSLRMMGLVLAPTAGNEMEPT
eukprot:3543874-Pyramimonas_sp.AAC.1